ncbi:MAG TPA: TonB-dependent receptor [Acidobacteriaceae bacterium]|nr:TonB-dependent receptor [Acidobacteriaceae bacterium]
MTALTALRRLPFVALLAAALFVLTPPAGGQVDTGAIVGTLSDSAGLRIPGAKVTVTEESTGVSTSVSSDADGSYIISPLKLGRYTLKAEKEGFKVSVEQHIEVTIQSRLEVNPTLQIGAVSESVQVSSTAPVLETQTSSLQQLVDTQPINDLPLNRRNATFLAQLSAGVTFAQNDARGLQASGSFTANGFGRTENDYMLDGMDNNSEIGDLVNQTQYVILPPPDALREFTVQTSNYSAEFGHSAGAVLNVTTKSGTNTFHGDVWEFLRNDYFDAKDYFVLSSQRKPEFRLNQFGFTFGGPVTIPHVYNGKNRTFFFVDYQGFRQVQGQTFTESVPTLAEQNSGFQNLQDLVALQTGTTTDLLGRTFPKGTVFDPATTRAITKGVVDPVTHLTATATGYVRDPFYTGSLVGMTSFTNPTAEAQMNTIPQSRISPVALKLLRLYPNPNGKGLVSNYTVSPNNTQQTDSMDSRLDQQIGASDSIFFRYSYLYQTQFQASPLPGVADGAASRPGTGQTEAQNSALGWTHTITAHLVNEARVGYSRIYDKRFQNDANVLGIPAQYGIPGVPQIPENGGLPLFTFSQLSNLGAAGTNPSDKASDVFQVTENITIDRDKHQVRTGFEYQHVAYPMLTPTQPRGNFTNNGVFTSVLNSTDGSTDRAQFLLIPVLSPYAPQQNYLGGANSLTASSFPPAYYPIRSYYGAYVEDNYRLTQSLTLNLGVRYEYIGSPTEKTGRFGSLVSSYTGDSPDGQSHYYVPSENVGGLPANFLTLLSNNNIALTPSSNSIGSAQKSNFAPRVGFAFQPQRKIAVRGGFGIFYQPNESHGLSTAPYVDFPFQVSASYTAQSAQEAIIANPTTDTTPEGTVGPVYEGLQNVSLSPAAASLGSLSFNGEPPHPKTTYGEAYNLQIQYQVGRQTIVYAGYVGGNTRHVETNMNTNSTTVIAPPSTALASIAFFKTVATGGSYVGRDGQTNYNSLQFGGERRFSNGFSFIANMTWGKCLGDTRDLLDNGLGGYRAPYVPGMGINADYTLCTIDVRRIVHTSGIYESRLDRIASSFSAAPQRGWRVDGR